MPSSPSPFGVLHHIGIAVHDLAATRDALCALLGGAVVDEGQDEQLAIAWLWIEAPGSPIIELLMPLNDESPVARDLRRRGAGLHHLSYEPPSLSAAKDHVGRCCMPVIGEQDDHAGYEELFVHPSATGGALFHAFRTLPKKGDAT